MSPRLWFLFCLSGACVETNLKGEGDTALFPPTDTAPADDSSAPDTAARTACRDILVYSTEDATGSDSYAGFFDGLEADPLLTGWTVEVVERNTGGRLSAEMLAGRSQLWLFGVDRTIGTELQTAEVNAALDFVAAGGGVLIAAEHEDTSYSYVDDVNGLAEPLGVSFHGFVAEIADGELRPVKDGAPTFTGDVTRLPGFASVAELEILDAAVEPIFEWDGQPSMAYRTDGTRVVFDRSWGGWRDYFRPAGDQGRMMFNVATWLEPCP